MSNIKRFTAIAFAGVALFSTPAFASDSAVIGSWAIVADTQMGKIKATMTVAEEDGAYTVDIVDAPMEGAPAGGGGPEAAPPESTISDVVVDGSEFSFKRKLVTPQFSVDLNYKGTVDGDTLTGEAGSDFGASKITGIRQD